LRKIALFSWAWSTVSGIRTRHRDARGHGDRWRQATPVRGLGIACRRRTMLERLNVGRPARVIGADGKPLTLQDLPANDGRWSKKRKAQVVAAVRGNLITFEDAVRRYGLSPGEFIVWESEVLVFITERQRAVERRDFRVLRRQASADTLRRLQAG